MKIRTKIIGGFLIVFAIGLVLGLFGLYSLKKVSDMSKDLAKIQEANASVLDVLGAHYVWRQNLTISVFTGAEFKGSYDPNTCALGKWRNSDEAAETVNEEIQILLNKLDAPHAYIHNEAKFIIDNIAAGNGELATEHFVTQVLPKTGEAIDILSLITEQYSILHEAQDTAITKFQNMALTVIISLIFLAMILSLAVATLILRSIMKPIRKLAETAEIISSGNLNVNFDHGVNDEIGMLTRNFAALTNTLRTIIDDIGKMSAAHDSGDTDYKIDEAGFKGDYRTMVEGINNMVYEYIVLLRELIGCLDGFGNGDFNANIKPLPGKKAVVNVNLDKLRENLQNVSASINYLVNAASDGDLLKRADVGNFKGDWASILENLNSMLEAIDLPVEEISGVLQKVEGGNLHERVMGDYKGKFLEVKNALNSTTTELSAYIDNISYLLGEIADNNLDLRVDREYKGDFADIKTALNTIVSKLNDTIGNIASATEQVMTGAKSISESSMTLATGATEQAGSVEELTSTVNSINEQTAKNAEDASNANSLSESSKENALAGNAEMKKMLESMEGIKNSSANISKIIKTIEDIAFQTNLLALNAAVEAARAGEHGKGFAVVAEEVRNLAARSQNAAKETNELIEDSISRVNDGSSIAQITADSLETIVKDVNEVSGIISNIAESSVKQAESIASLNQGLQQISDVVQSNSSASEESAAAAQELHSQSDMLSQMVSAFKLKRN